MGEVSVAAFQGFAAHRVFGGDKARPFKAVAQRPRVGSEFHAKGGQKMSNITSLSEFRASRIERERQRREEALAAEALAAVKEAIGHKQVERRLQDSSAANARLEGQSKTALVFLRYVPGVVVIVSLASLAVTDLTVTALLISGVAMLGWCANGIASELSGAQ